LLNRLSNDLLTLGRYQQIATDSAAICRIKRIDCKTEGCGTGSAQDHNVGRCYGVNYNFIGSFDNGNPPSVFANSGREIVMTPMQAGTLLHFKNGSCARLSGRDQLARIPQRFARAGSRLLLRCRIGRRFGCDANFRTHRVWRQKPDDHRAGCREKFAPAHGPRLKRACGQASSMARYIAP